MAVQICAWRSPMCGMERGRQHIVVNFVYFFLQQLTLLQCYTIALSYHSISLCEEDYGDRHPWWEADRSV